MLHIEIRKDTNLFDKVFICDWKNTVSKDNHGSFSAPDYNTLNIALKKTIIDQTSLAIKSITAERRYVYKNCFRPSTMFEANIQKSCLERCDIADSVAKNISGQSMNNISDTILKLCSGVLAQLIPGVDKKKHDAIKFKVEQIKTFFSDKLGSIDLTLLEKTSKIEF